MEGRGRAHCCWGHACRLRCLAGAADAASQPTTCCFVSIILLLQEKPPCIEEMLSFNTLTPHYEEDVIYALNAASVARHFGMDPASARVRQSPRRRWRRLRLLLQLLQSLLAACRCCRAVVVLCHIRPSDSNLHVCAGHVRPDA